MTVSSVQGQGLPLKRGTLSTVTLVSGARARRKRATDHPEFFAAAKGGHELADPRHEEATIAVGLVTSHEDAPSTTAGTRRRNATASSARGGLGSDLIGG